jgi:hypothetical protein
MSIPPCVRYEYRARVYWVTYWKNATWTVGPDDDISQTVHCSGNWRDAIDEYERED